MAKNSAKPDAEDANPSGGQEVVKRLKSKKAKGDKLPVLANTEAELLANELPEGQQKKSKKKRKAESTQEAAAADAQIGGAAELKSDPVATEKPKKKNRKLSEDASTNPAGESAEQPEAKPEGLLKKLKKKLKASLGVADSPAPQPVLDSAAAAAPASDAVPLAIGSGDTVSKKKKKKQKKAAPQAADDAQSAGIEQPPSVVEAAPGGSKKSEKAAEEQLPPISQPINSPPAQIPVVEEESVISEPETAAVEEALQAEAIAPGRTPGSGRAFQRVKSDEWMTLKAARDNSYTGTFGQSGWGARAQEILGQVRGKDFRHEKTKKKRGTYKGGLIESGAVNSFKFDSDDD